MSSAQQPALSPPAQAAAILRSLPGLAERLRASQPPSNEDLRELKARLEAVVPLIGDGIAAPALLSNALLNVLAVALRQPLAGSDGAQGSGAGREELRLGLLRYNIAHRASYCCSSLLSCVVAPLHAKRQLSFGLRLMRTQPLQCCARRLAEKGPRGRAASSGAARAHDRQQKALVVVAAAGTALLQSLQLILALASLAVSRSVGDAPPPHSELGQLWDGLMAALRDSSALEHAARMLLLLLLPSQRLQPGEGKDFTRVGVLVRIIISVTLMALCNAPVGDAVPSATSVPSTIAAELQGLLSGRCVRHAVLVLGVAALCTADGGTSYGLPGELLRHVPVIGRREGPGREAVDLRHANGRVVMDSVVLENMVHVLRRGARGVPPGRQVALALMLRMGRLVVTSGRAHLGASESSTEAETIARHERAGSASGSGSGSGSSSGSGGSSGSRRGGSGGGGGGRQQEQATVRPQLPRPPATPGLQLRLDEAALRPLFLVALERAMELCFPARPAERPERAVARAECWRLFAAYTRDVLPLRGEFSCSPVRHLQDPGAMLPGAPLPASPPLSWADALAGGWLPCLERLLRRGGEDPAGPETRLAVRAIACLLGWEPFTPAWRHLAVLLAYGEPRQAAALVATLGKLLHAADLAALVESTTKGGGIAAAGALWALTGAVEEWEATSGAAASKASTAALPAQSAAGRQLALMVSCAACEWLPLLARLAMRAMEPTALPAAGRLRSVPAAAGDSQDHAVMPAVMLLLPLLGWLPVLAQRCTLAAFGEGVADAPAIGVAPVPQAQFPWRPQQLRALGAGVREEGWDAEADGADALAALLQSWEAGEGEAEAEAGAQAEGGGNAAGAAWRRVEECSALFKNERQVALALVPVAEARSVLRTCSYSG
ncbi:hypothetical protein TSOC_004073 [Tetrabaena socialis]|uniref:Uncharacterized protein n=1 Tax=Tetrabaena socialis TaxID=47790 RepID=A0A2J8AA10_9CHLO|nr:hypothetical protein TSOC_004073 [Tetrabaena socialis]|eukprot:PNH09335.1 hypothetical protein TSOC_004073 [Tetrabaena socialis]